MEEALSSNYPVVTEGHTIAVYNKENETVYHIDIIKTEPASIIKIIDVNIDVDFEPPLDYVPVEQYDKIKFPGKGRRLGTN